MSPILPCRDERLRPAPRIGVRELFRPPRPQAPSARPTLERKDETAQRSGRTAGVPPQDPLSDMLVALRPLFAQEHAALVVIRNSRAAFGVGCAPFRRTCAKSSSPCSRAGLQPVLGATRRRRAAPVGRASRDPSDSTPRDASLTKCFEQNVSLRLHRECRGDVSGDATYTLAQYSIEPILTHKVATRCDDISLSGQERRELRWSRDSWWATLTRPRCSPDCRSVETGPCAWWYVRRRADLSIVHDAGGTPSGSSRCHRVQVRHVRCAAHRTGVGTAIPLTATRWVFDNWQCVDRRKW
jgi:hypothetical protein